MLPFGSVTLLWLSIIQQISSKHRKVIPDCTKYHKKHLPAQSFTVQSTLRYMMRTQKVKVFLCNNNIIVYYIRIIAEPLRTQRFWNYTN